MLADEIRKLEIDEIETRLEDARENLMKLRFQTATGELQDTNQLQTTRRLIARLLTVLREQKAKTETEGEK